jgi:dienelactone hydrolase
MTPMRMVSGNGRIIGAIALAALCSQAVAAGLDDGELERTWQASRVYLPSPESTGFRTAGIGEIEALSAPDIRTARAVVVYAHGCDGLSRITDVTCRFLAQAGYIVIAPDGFARKDKPKSCNPATHQGGLHRAVLGWRQAEIRHALSHVSHISPLDDLPVILMGHSEGAIAVATLDTVSVTARIVEGWTCHAGWPEYRGLHGDSGQPVLALVGTNDPWFGAAVLKGDCGTFMDDGGASRSIVFSEPNYLSGKHWLSADSDVQSEIIDFIEDAVSTRSKNNAE